jgi:CPA2 family monovalent cation:H+ antiporter-2
MGAEITALRRGRSGVPLTPEAVLQAGDIVVLRGAADAISRAEGRLLQAWASTSHHSDEDF